VRVLVCGGRDFDNWERMTDVLEPIGASVIIEGGAKGADFLARAWAKDRCITVEEFEADWKAYGKKAGPIRNQQMIDEGKPELVVAFPGGFGTNDMMRRAEKAGIPVKLG
jgi:hypothetical protein